MLGAIIGDIVGSPYEFDQGDKTKDFPLISSFSEFTDDTVLTVAVLEALLDVGPHANDDTIRTALHRTMRRYADIYPNAGYGSRFYGWLHSTDPQPYNSYGNGSAMRVSPAGWLYDTLPEVLHAAKLTAEVTHNHPEGIKGAQATAAAIFLARTGHSKQEIKEYIVNTFEYDLSRTCDEIRPTYFHVESCQETVPEAITAFLDGTDFEDVIRTAVSLGGDCDTLTAIAGSIAEAYYGIPAELQEIALAFLNEHLMSVLRRCRLPHYIAF